MSAPTPTHPANSSHQQPVQPQPPMHVTQPTYFSQQILPPLHPPYPTPHFAPIMNPGPLVYHGQHHMPIPHRHMILLHAQRYAKDVKRKALDMAQATEYFHLLGQAVFSAQGRRTPIARMPVEVLAQIFNWAKDELPNEYAFQFTIARVCKHWRRIVFSAPSMWSDYDIWNDITLMEANRFIMMYSKATRLNISIEGVWCHDASNISADEMFKFLKRWQHRIEKLNFQGCSHIIKESFMNVFQENLRIRDMSLRIAACGVKHLEMADGPIPRLETSLERLFIDLENPRIVQINAPALKKLIINARRSSIEDIFQTIRECGHIEELTLTFSDDVHWSYETDMESKWLELPNLRNLRLQDLPVLVWEKMRVLWTPRLDILTIIGDQRNGYAPDPRFHVPFLFLLQHNRTLREVLFDIDNIDLMPLVERMTDTNKYSMLPNLEMFGVRSRRTGPVNYRSHWAGPMVDTVFDPVLCPVIRDFARARAAGPPCFGRLKELSLFPRPGARQMPDMLTLPGVKLDFTPATYKRVSYHDL
ncbi:hypothetical protein DACRYDRAFT_17128 [Dacryopinax primogenitus]|uniref:F-box domain-containing protein n=1 Tax=Dacryopinax primogenitus (strain DJM 731) TaxID=1858805 RepID=M5G8J1_DACPD|nr:uncharacterized protein DACRYDRAFT_17128 [Dacryopinax primogenitus]EJU00083.1 hypothetical protein DACRYDRAFT_17128 [Dacryopinax primogenitus]